MFTQDRVMDILMELKTFLDKNGYLHRDVVLDLLHSLAFMAQRHELVHRQLDYALLTGELVNEDDLIIHH